MVLPHERIERPPVELGHVEVRENDIIALRLELREGMPPIARRVHAVADAPEQPLERADDARLIVDNQNRP